MVFWQEYKEQDVDCDKLQRIHALENLASLLEDCPDEKDDEAVDKGAQLIEEVSGCHGY